MRGSRRRKVEYMLDLDVRALARVGLLASGASGSWSWRYTDGAAAYVGIRAEEGAVILSFSLGHGDVREQIEQRVALDRTMPNFGGSRSWWRCPNCGRRAAVLYAGQRFRCRCCAALAYTSTCEGRSDRLLRRVRKLRARLGAGPGVGDPLLRPRGMHWTTYVRLAMKVVAMEEEAINTLMMKR